MHSCGQTSIYTVVVTSMSSFSWEQYVAIIVPQIWHISSTFLTFTQYILTSLVAYQSFRCDDRFSAFVMSKLRPNVLSKLHQPEKIALLYSVFLSTTKRSIFHDTRGREIVGETYIPPLRIVPASIYVCHSQWKDCISLD